MPNKGGCAMPHETNGDWPKSILLNCDQREEDHSPYSVYSFGVLLCAICFTPIQPVAIHIAALCADFIFRQHFFRTLQGAANAPIIIAEVFALFINHSPPEQPIIRLNLAPHPKFAHR